MAGYVAVGNNIYESAVVATGNVIKAGNFVDITEVDGGATAALCADAPTTPAYFAVPEDDSIEEELIATNDLEWKADEFVKAKRLLPGESFITNMIKNGETMNIGSQYCAASGVVAAVSGTPAQTFVLQEVVTYAGGDAYRFKVID